MHIIRKGKESTLEAATSQTEDDYLSKKIIVFLNLLSKLDMCQDHSQKYLSNFNPSYKEK